MEENNFSDDQIGRARVQDSPELVAYYKELETLGAGALWTVANDIEPWEPRSSSVPMLWKYDDLRDLVLKSSELVTPEQAGRRVVYLVNDKRKDVSAAVGWLYTGIQVTRPGESTSAHRHKASALRFIMEGEKGYTVVDGNKIMLEVNDFVITPNSTWHEHGVEEGGKTCIWQDGLDIPLVNALEANDYAVYDGKQPLVKPLNYSPITYGCAGLIPADKTWDKPYSPLFKYSWKNVYPALLEAQKVNEVNPFDGIFMQYDANHGSRDAIITSWFQRKSTQTYGFVHISMCERKRFFYYQRTTFRLERKRYFLCSELGLARTPQPFRNRRCLSFSIQRFTCN
jgi:gentisate 1,2-dioxygenase